MPMTPQQWYFMMEQMAQMGQGAFAPQTGGGTQQQPGQPSAFPSGTPVVIDNKPISSGTTSTSPTAGPTSTPTDPNTGFPPAVGGNTPTNAPFAPPGQELGTSPAGSSDPYDPNYPYGAGSSSGDPLTFGGYNPFSPPVFQGGVDQQPAVGGPTDTTTSDTGTPVDTQVITPTWQDPSQGPVGAGPVDPYAGPSDVLNQPPSTPGPGGIPTSTLDPTTFDPTTGTNPLDVPTAGTSPDPYGGSPASFYPDGLGGYTPLDAFGNPVGTPTPGSNPFIGGAFATTPGNINLSGLGQGSFGNISNFGWQDYLKGKKFGFTPGVVGGGFPVNNPVHQFGEATVVNKGAIPTNISQYFSRNTGFTGDDSSAQGLGGPNQRSVAAK